MQVAQAGLRLRPGELMTFKVMCLLLQVSMEHLLSVGDFAFPLGGLDLEVLILQGGMSEITQLRICFLGLIVLV